jgi:hypothetical protein
MGDDRKDGQQGFTVSDKRKRFEEPATAAGGAPEAAAAGGVASAGAASGPVPGDAEHGHPGEGGIPPADFPQLIMKLAEEAVVFMGYHDDPKGGQPMANLTVASWHIDLLEMLKGKTKGNLAEGEAKLLEEATANLKMLFVRATGLIKH